MGGPVCIPQNTSRMQPSPDVTIADSAARIFTFVHFRSGRFCSMRFVTFQRETGLHAPCVILGNNVVGLKGAGLSGRCSSVWIEGGLRSPPARPIVAGWQATRRRGRSVPAQSPAAARLCPGRPKSSAWASTIATMPSNPKWRSPRSRPSTSRSTRPPSHPTGQGNQHLGRLAESKIVAPTPHIRG